MTIIGEAMRRQGLSTAVVAERAGYSWWLIDRLAHDEASLARATLVQIGSVCEAVGLEPVEVLRHADLRFYQRYNNIRDIRKHKASSNTKG